MKKVLNKYIPGPSEKSGARIEPHDQTHIALGDVAKELASNRSQIVKLEQKIDRIANRKQSWFDYHALIVSVVTPSVVSLLKVASYPELVYLTHHPSQLKSGFSTLAVAVFAYCGFKIYRSFVDERSEAMKHGQIVVNTVQAMFSVCCFAGALLSLLLTLVTNTDQAMLYGGLDIIAGMSTVYNYRQAMLLLRLRTGAKATFRDLMNYVSAAFNSTLATS